MKCIEVLTAWSDELFTDPAALQKMVELHPVEPYKTWEMEGRGKVGLICTAYRCPRCGKGWVTYRRA